MTVYEAIRLLYPRSRRPQPVGIIRNGSRKRVVQCIHCGACESCSAEWKETKRVRDFRASHNEECGVALIDKAEQEAVARSLRYLGRSVERI